MRKLHHLLLHLYFLLILSALLPINLDADDLLDQLNANHDHGLWLDFNGNFNLPLKEVFILPRIGFRWGADFKKFYYEIYECVLQQTILNFKRPYYSIKTFSLGPGYAAVYSLRKNTKGIYQWVLDNRTIAEGNLGSSIGKWTIDQRMRGEYRAYSKPHFINHGVYRHRLVIHTPSTFLSKNIQPFVFNEWFFRKNTYSSSNTEGLVGGWYENRFRVGSDFIMRKNVTVTLYWQWKINKEKPGSSPSWKQNYDLGLNLSCQN